MILKCVKETLLTNGEQTILFQVGEKLASIVHIDNTIVELSFYLDGHKKWHFKPEDWRRESSLND